MADAGRSIEAIRYIVFRRMARGLCHKMFSGVQAVQFATELCRRKLQTRTPGEMDTELAKIASQATDVVKACRSLADWLWPDSSSSEAFGETLAGCVKLAADDWMLRSIQGSVHFSKSVEAVAISRSMVYELVSLSLLALIDACGNALDIELAAELVDSEIVLNIKPHPSTREAPPALPLPRADEKLDWRDVMLVAEAHNVKCSCNSADASITLRFEQRVDAMAGSLQ